METYRVSSDAAPVAVFAPIGRDAEIAGRLLQPHQYSVVSCCDLDHVLASLNDTLCLIVTEEALLQYDRTRLASWIDRQPPWSEYPVIVLATRGRELDVRLDFLQHSSVVLERPFNPSSLIRAVHSAARSRRRQLQVKNYLEERERTDERQKLLIRELHHRVKNTLSNVQALLGATARSHSDIDGFTRASQAGSVRWRRHTSC
jgi:DNA-binding response OmpR family regulator